MSHLAEILSREAKNDDQKTTLHTMPQTPILIVLRGNSGSGKSSVAKALRQRFGYGMAWIEQDYIRRILLREPDQADASNIELIAMNVRFALQNNYHVVLEGILDAELYSNMIHCLYTEYTKQCFFYYFDLPFSETERRHATRPQKQEFSTEQMKSWYKQRDFLPFIEEKTLHSEYSLESIVQMILNDTQLHSSSNFNQSTR